MRSKSAIRYFSAVGLAIVALILRLAARDVLGPQAPFVTFYIAVVLAAWLLGTGPAILVTLAGGASVLILLFEPAGVAAWPSAGEQIWLAFYFLIAGTVISTTEMLRRARAVAEAKARLAADRLEQVEREVAERERAQRAENEQRQWYETTLRSIGDAVIATDDQARVTFLNAAAESLTGWPSAEASGRPISDVFDIRHEETGKPAEIPVSRVLREGCIVGLAYHTVLLSRHGTVVPIDDSAAPIRNADGQLLGVVLVFRNIADRKKAERALRQSVEEMERFAYIASHDLQEPIRTVSAFAELLGRHLGERADAESAEYIQYIRDGTRKMRSLVTDLLEYSRAGATAISIAEVQAQEIVADALEALKALIESSGARIECSSLPSIYADRVKVTQVFQNLIANSIKFRGEQTPVIKIRAEEKDGFHCFSIRDNGIGFDPKYRERIFGMFQRLEPAGGSEGSGIGLAVCRRIVENHDGRIWAESEPGSGSTFWFTIPCQPQQAAGKAAKG